MGEIATIFSAVATVADLAVNLAGALLGNLGNDARGEAERDDSGPGVYVTGDVVWYDGQDYYGQPAVFAYTTSSADTAVTFLNPDTAPGTVAQSAHLVLQAGAGSTDVTALVKQYTTGGINMCTLATDPVTLLRGASGDLGGGATSKAVCLAVPSLALGVAAPIMDGVTFTVTADAGGPQIQFKVARPRFTGTFSATVNNSSFSATVSGSIERYGNTGDVEEFDFALPPFLQIGVWNAAVDWIEVVMVVPASELTLQTVQARVLKGRRTPPALSA